MPNWLHKCSYTCWLTHAPRKWFFHRQPTPLLTLEGYLIPLLSWKRDRARGDGERGEKKEELDWLEKNNRGLRKLSRQGRVSLLSDSRSESSSSWNLCSWDRPSRAWQSSRMMSNIISDQIYCYTITIQTPYFNCAERGNEWQQLN